MRHLTLPLAALAALACAAPAAAAPISASAGDAQDSTARGPGSDLQQVRTTFDPQAGTWSVTVRFWGPMSTADWAMVNATIFTPGDDPSDCGAGGESFGWLRASTEPGSTTVTGAAGADDDPPQPDGAVGPTPLEGLTRTESTDERELTLAGQGPGLVGRAPGCVTVTTSYHGVIDTLGPAGAPFTTAVAPGGDDGGSGANGGSGDGGSRASGGARDGGSGGTTGDGSGATGGAGAGRRPALRLRLRPATATLHAGTLRVRLAPLGRRATGTATLTHGHRTLAHARFHASRRHPVVLRLHGTRAGHRWIRHHRHGHVRLVVRARTAAGAHARRAFRLRLQR